MSVVALVFKYKLKYYCGVLLMPVMYVCGSCGYPLSVFVKVGQNSYGVPTPDEVIAQYGGICLRCGSPLRRPRLDDIVIKVDGKKEFARRIFEIQREYITGTKFLNKYLDQLDLDPEVIDDIRREVFEGSMTLSELDVPSDVDDEVSTEESSS